MKIPSNNEKYSKKLVESMIYYKIGCRRNQVQKILFYQ